MKSIISIKDLLSAFNSSVKGAHFLFYWVPLIGGFLSPFILYGGNSKAATIINSFLTSFVPLFATILTFYLSWCYNKIRTRHNAERLQLFRETSTNILIMIPIDVLAVILYCLSSITWFDTKFNVNYLCNQEITTILNSLSFNILLKYIIFSLYYSCVLEIVFIILMVCKRAFVIINNEISLLSENSEEQFTHDGV